MFFRDLFGDWDLGICLSFGRFVWGDLGGFDDLGFLCVICSGSWGFGDSFDFFCRDWFGDFCFASRFVWDLGIWRSVFFPTIYLGIRGLFFFVLCLGIRLFFSRFVWGFVDLCFFYVIWLGICGFVFFPRFVWRFGDLVIFFSDLFGDLGICFAICLGIWGFVFLRFVLRFGDLFF